MGHLFDQDYYIQINDRYCTINDHQHAVILKVKVSVIVCFFLYVQHATSCSNSSIQDSSGFYHKWFR